jgi:uncharacterized membrane protein
MIGNLIFLIIDILLLVISVVELNFWRVHPEESKQRIFKRFRVLRKIFFFLPPFFAMNFYERNPERMMQRYRTGSIIAIIILVIGFVLAIISMVAGK